MTLDEFKTRERLPDLWLDEVFETEKFIMIETERELKDGKFTSCKITKKVLV